MTDLHQYDGYYFRVVAPLPACVWALEFTPQPRPSWLYGTEVPACTAWVPLEVSALLAEQDLHVDPEDVTMDRYRARVQDTWLTADSVWPLHIDSKLAERIDRTRDQLLAQLPFGFPMKDVELDVANSDDPDSLTVGWLPKALGTTMTDAFRQQERRIRAMFPEMYADEGDDPVV